MYKTAVIFISLVLVIFGFTSVSFAQSAEAASSVVAEVELYLKIGVAVITGLGALLGLPMVYLTYKKTSVEIRKLELEARQLSTSSSGPSNLFKSPDKGIRVQVHDSPNTNVHVSADPRFLAPLLVLLDFIFAWILLTLASYFIRIFSLGVLGRLGLLLLALFLLTPLAHQVMKIRHVMQPNPSLIESPLAKQLRIIAHFVYIAAALFAVITHPTTLCARRKAPHQILWI